MTREDLHKRCEEEGLSIMQDVFDIIIDRGEAGPRTIMRWLDADENRSVYTLYEDCIVSGINRLSDAIQENAPDPLAFDAAVSWLPEHAPAGFDPKDVFYVIGLSTKDGDRTVNLSRSRGGKFDMWAYEHELLPLSGR